MKLLFLPVVLVLAALFAAQPSQGAKRLYP